jgi:hypothetical protein
LQHTHVEICDVGEQDFILGDAAHVENWDAMLLRNIDREQRKWDRVMDMTSLYRRVPDLGGSLCDILPVGAYVVCEHASFIFFKYTIMYTFILAPQHDQNIGTDNQRTTTQWQRW